MKHVCKLFSHILPKVASLPSLSIKHTGIYFFFFFFERRRARCSFLTTLSGSEIVDVNEWNITSMFFLLWDRELFHESITSDICCRINEIFSFVTSDVKRRWRCVILFCVSFYGISTIFSLWSFDNVSNRSKIIKRKKENV